MASFIYEYRCPECRNVIIDRRRGDRVYGYCIVCHQDRTHVRVFSFSYHRDFAEHFNHTTGTVVSSMRQFRDDLQRKGDEYSAYTGLDTNYQPVDWADIAREQMTDEGMTSTNNRRIAQGLRPIEPG